MAKTTLTKQNKIMKELLKEAYSRKGEVCSEGDDWFEKVRELIGDELVNEFEHIGLTISLPDCQIPALKDVYDIKNYTVEVKFDGKKLNIDNIEVSDTW